MAAFLDRQMLCAAYIRITTTGINREHSTTIIFPEPLVLIVVEYAKKYFEWDSVNCRKNIEISEDKMTATSLKGGNQIVVSANDLSSELVSRAEWELVLGNVNDEINNGICLSMGFVAFPLNKSLVAENCGRFLSGKDHCSVYIHDSNTHFEIYEYNQRNGERMQGTKSKAVKNGDRLKLVFDFESKQLDFHYNGDFCGTVTKQLADHLIPTVAVCGKHSFQCTKWKMKYCGK